MSNRKHNIDQIKIDYQQWIANNRGTNKEFVQRVHPEITETSLYAYLKKWRMNPTRIKALAVLAAEQKAEKQKDESLVEEASSQNLILGHLIPSSIKIYEDGIKSGNVNTAQHKMAKEVLEANGYLGKKEIQKKSIFNTWSTKLLEDFVQALTVQVLTARDNTMDENNFTPMVEPEQYNDPARNDAEAPLTTMQTQADKPS